MPIQTQASFHLARTSSHSMLLNPPRNGTLSNAPCAVRWPQMGKILTQPSAAGLPSLPCSLAQSVSCPALTYGRARAALPVSASALPCAQTLWSGLVKACNPPRGIWLCGRKEGDCLPVLFLQVQVIKMAFPTLKSGSFFQVRWWSDGTREHLTKSCWRFMTTFQESLGPASSNMQAAPCS